LAGAEMMAQLLQDMPVMQMLAFALHSSDSDSCDDDDDNNENNENNDNNNENAGGHSAEVLHNNYIILANST